MGSCRWVAAVTSLHWSQRSGTQHCCDVTRHCSHSHILCTPHGADRSRGGPQPDRPQGRERVLGAAGDAAACGAVGSGCQAFAEVCVGGSGWDANKKPAAAGRSAVESGGRHQRVVHVSEGPGPLSGRAFGAALGGTRQEWGDRTDPLFTPTRLLRSCLPW